MSPPHWQSRLGKEAEQRVDVEAVYERTSSDEIINDDYVLSVPDSSILHFKYVLSQRTNQEWHV